MQPSPIAKASNPYTKPQARHPGSLLKGYANGGAIEGPGTATSDSIPAKVKQTGEPIQVANGERIVSADQDALLLRIAKAMGHKSVDEMFQAGTGKPVGPTVKYGKKHAAGGANPYDLMKNKIGRAPDGLTLQDAAAASTSNGFPAQVPDPASAIGPTPAASLAPTVKPPGAFADTQAVAGAVDDAVSSAWKKGDVSGAVGNYGRGMLATGVAGAIDATAKAGSLLRPVGNAISTFATGEGLAPAGVTVAPNTPAASPLVNPGAPLSASEMAKRQTQLPGEASAIAAAPPPSPILGDTEGVSVGNGITRFDMAGKQTSSVGPPLPVPLFTNRTDAAGMADNAALTNRAPMTTQNQGAMDGIQSRQDARMSAMVSKAQYDREVAGAQAVNDAGERLNLEYSLRNGNPQERATAMVLLNAANATAKDLRGNAVVTRGQDITANASSQANKLAQNKDTREGAAFDAQQKSLLQLAALHTELGKETDPAKRYHLLERILALQGKEKPAQYKTTALQAVKNADGSTSPGMVVTTNEQTGEAKVIDPSARPAGSVTPRAEYDKLPKGATYIGTDGQHYTKG